MKRIIIYPPFIVFFVPVSAKLIDLQTNPLVSHQKHSGPPLPGGLQILKGAQRLLWHKYYLLQPVGLQSQGELRLLSRLFPLWREPLFLLLCLANGYPSSKRQNKLSLQEAFLNGPEPLQHTHLWAPSAPEHRLF